MFSLWGLIKCGLLLTNAVAILHETRFLKNCTSQARSLSLPTSSLTPHAPLTTYRLATPHATDGMDRMDNPALSSGSVKHQMTGFLTAVRYLRSTFTCVCVCVIL